jgi:hypothetical protein
VFGTGFLVHRKFKNHIKFWASGWTYMPLVGER